MRRLRSLGNIEKLDGLCRKIPHCQSNPHERPFQAPLHMARPQATWNGGEAALYWPRMEGKTASPHSPKISPWPKPVPNHRVSGSILSPLPVPQNAQVPPWQACLHCCKLSTAQRAGRCATQRDRRPKFPTQNRSPSRVGPQRSARAREPLPDNSRLVPSKVRKPLRRCRAAANRTPPRLSIRSKTDSSQRRSHSRRRAAWRLRSAACWKRHCNFAAPCSSARPNLPRACRWCRTPKNPNT